MGGGKEIKKHVQIQEPKMKGYFLHNGPGFQRAKSFVHPGQLLSQQNKELMQLKGKNSVLAYSRNKPDKELYRPPTIRNSWCNEPNGDFSNDTKGFIYEVRNFPNSDLLQSARRKPGLNIYAQEFHPDSCLGNGLQHSKSSGSLKMSNGQIAHSNYQRREIKDKRPREHKVKFGVETKATSAVVSGFIPIKRSKSLGSADLLKIFNGPVNDYKCNLESFPSDSRMIFASALSDPNELSARQLIDVVHRVFQHANESSRNAEPTARLCVDIIENEESDTFLESLLNSCQEFYRERERLLRSRSSGAASRRTVNSYPRWIAYMSFLSELYTQLKRYHSHLMASRIKNGGTPPGLLLLTLIAQCCFASLQKTYVNSMAEVECLFFVLTTVGKDIEAKLPQQMDLVINAVRDAFLNLVHIPAVRKTLLQLIEMHAAKWQLPASAVMYYYPGSCAKLTAIGAA